MRFITRQSLRVVSQQLLFFKNVNSTNSLAVVNANIYGQSGNGTKRNYSAHFSYVPDTVASSEGETVRMNLFQGK